MVLPEKMFYNICPCRTRPIQKIRTEKSLFLVAILTPYKLTERQFANDSWYNKTVVKNISSLLLITIFSNISTI